MCSQHRGNAWSPRLFAADAQGRPYANARSLGVMHLIWDHHIWGAYRTDDGWRDDNGCTAKNKRGNPSTRPVKAWQDDHDLDDTGRFGYATWRALQPELAP